jgi:hypothetical protein
MNKRNYKKVVDCSPVSPISTELIALVMQPKCRRPSTVMRDISVIPTAFWKMTA